MNLYLSSFRIGNEFNYLKNWIRENNNKILLIPNARDVREKTQEEKDFLNYDIESLEKLGFDVTILDLKEFFNKESELEKYITDNNFHTFYTIGGNVFSLRMAMKLSGFDKFIEKIKDKNNFLYAGYSAGVCVLSPTLDGYDIVEKEKNPYNGQTIPREGLKIIEYCIVPHYKSNHRSSSLINEVIKYYNSKRIQYRVLKDGEVIISNSKQKEKEEFEEER